jgi:probable HAF family extracellular repeat protein
MLRKRRYRIWCVVAVLGLLTVVEPAFTADSYSVIDVATLEQAGGGIVRGINIAGDVIGAARFPSGKRGFRFGGIGSLAPSPVERLEGFLGTDGSSANAINELGAVAGASNTAAAIRAFLWTRTNGFRELGTLPGDSSSEAWGINRHNDVVGYSGGPNGIEAVLWESTGSLQRLGWLRDGDHSRAYAVNESGAVVGVSGKAGFTRAFLWTRRDGMEDLGAIPGNDESFATAINDAGQIVGYTSGAVGERAFLWSRTNRMVNLDTLPGGDNSRALAINEPGDIVGTSDSASGARAVVWTGGGKIRDLNTLIRAGNAFALTEAVSINNQGWILAIGHSEDGRRAVTRSRLVSSCWYLEALPDRDGPSQHYGLENDVVEDCPFILFLVARDSVVSLRVERYRRTGEPVGCRPMVVPA